MKSKFLLALPLAVTVSVTSVAEEITPAGPKSSGNIERGRYIVMTSGCNDCHTAGYMPSQGKVPEEEWLKGDTLGWRGPWGTTYAINLRRFAATMDEDQWVMTVKNAQARPPMPWWALQHMQEEDLRSIHAYIRSLPVNGDEAPAYLTPEQEPKTPYFTMIMPPAESK